jgi:hypothetical protein
MDGKDPAAPQMSLNDIDEPDPVQSFSFTNNFTRQMPMSIPINTPYFSNNSGCVITDWTLGRPIYSSGINLNAISNSAIPDVEAINALIERTKQIEKKLYERERVDMQVKANLEAMSLLNGELKLFRSGLKMQGERLDGASIRHIKFKQKMNKKFENVLAAMNAMNDEMKNAKELLQIYSEILPELVVKVTVLERALFEVGGPLYAMGLKDWQELNCNLPKPVQPIAVGGSGGGRKKRSRRRRKDRKRGSRHGRKAADVAAMAAAAAAEATADDVVREYLIPVESIY